MSYPYDLDLAFSSEKATADSNTSRVNETTPSGLPKTQEEVEELIAQGLAVQAPVEELVVNLEGLDPEVASSLPGNLKGIMMDDIESEGAVKSVNYTVTGDPQDPEHPLTITLESDEPPKSVYLILKEAVNTENP